MALISPGAPQPVMKAGTGNTLFTNLAETPTNLHGPLFPNPKLRITFSPPRHSQAHKKRYLAPYCFSYSSLWHLRTDTLLKRKRDLFS